MVGAGVGVLVRGSGGVDVRFFLEPPSRAALAGNFLFFSIAVWIVVVFADRFHVRRVVRGFVMEE